MDHPQRVRLGSWDFPSGNNAVVYLEAETGDGVRHVSVEWDDPPPLSPRDLTFYENVVLPKITTLVQQYTERPGPSLVVRLD